jgi:hypothetical protein
MTTIDANWPLFQFEIASSENLKFMPLCVRFNLDCAGLRVSLAEWQALSWQTRAALTAFPVESEADTPGGADFVQLLTQAMSNELGTVPADDPAAAAQVVQVIPDSAHINANVERQCRLIGVPIPDHAAWAALSDFQRYALAKLSRKEVANHDFLPALLEFGLIR